MDARPYLTGERYWQWTEQ